MTRSHRITRLIVEALCDGFGIARRRPVVARARDGYGDYELPAYVRKGIHIPGLGTTVEIDGHRHRLH